MRLLFLIFFMMSSPCWAYLTAGKVAVTATSSSSGVPSTSQDSDISDTVGSSVSVGVPVAVTGNVNITGNYQVNGTPISATSNWSQVGNTINYTAGNVGIGSVTPGQALDVAGTIRATGIIAAPQYMKFSNTQTQNTGGGTATSGSWLVYTLNTKDNDTAGIATLSTNTVALPAGTYIVHARCPSITVDDFQIRLYNVTASSVLINGSSEENNSGQGGFVTNSFIDGLIVLSVPSTIEIQYQVQTTQNATGQGHPANFGTEVYGVLELTRIK